MHIDPLYLIHREEVAALSLGSVWSRRRERRRNGILWRRVGDLGKEEDWLSLKDIIEHLREIYVGNSAYEVRFWPWYWLLSFVHFSFTMTTWIQSVYALSIEYRESLVSSCYFHWKHSAINEEKKLRIHELLSRSEVLDNLQLNFLNLIIFLL